MCSSFCEVDDFTSVRWYPSPCFSSTSIATKVLSAMNVASNTAGAPASSAACVAARRSARALCGRSMSTPPGYRARAASPTCRPWSNRSCSTLSGCSSSAPGSCTSHQSFLWHWRPEVKRDLERRAGFVVMARRVARGWDRGPGLWPPATRLVRVPKRVARHHVYVIELDPAVLQHAKGVEEVAPGRKEMAKTSAGLLMFRLRNGEPEVLLGHPGGPFWASKDEGAWSIPKGEFAAGEEPLAAAQREFEEETGCRAQGPFIPLTPITQRGGKVVYAWAV